MADRLIQTSDESKERKVLYKALKKAIEVHADAEERYFYVPQYGIETLEYLY